MHRWDRLQETHRVRMSWPRKEGFDGRRLDDLPGVHDADPIAQLGDDAQVVGDEKDGGADPPDEIIEDRQDLPLHGHVEGRGRLVGNQQGGPTGELHGDHGPLLHAA